MRKSSSAPDEGVPDIITAFQPALIAIEQNPPNPLGRKVLWVLLGFLALLLAGACVFSVDIVAVAQGKLVPATYLKVVQPPEPGIVREILVREGEAVRAGQVLMRMDRQLADADGRSLQTESDTRRWQLKRIDAQLKGSPMPPPDGTAPEIYRQVLTQYQSGVQAYEAALGQEQSQLEKAQQDLAAAEEIRSKLTQVLPIYEEREASYDQLAQKGYVSRIDQVERRRERIERQQDLRTQEFASKAARALIAQSRQKIQQIRSEYRRQLQAERSDAALQYAQLAQELDKYRTRQGWLELKAPQDGIVKEISTHTAGTVVSAGTVLLTLVPKDDSAIAEVWVSNEDSGFVHPGQEVKLKLASYAFQKYGMVDGVVQDVSADSSDAPAASANAGTDPETPPSALPYRARIRLKTQHLEARGRRYELRPGMQVIAEIKQGERRVIEYLLSPVTGTVQEAGRER